ncbi:MAG: hypothetical protein FWC85_04090, partial [Elusimicrobia bacterium]|nr:hypothetical protein [Elusimicrobiota bacterium]
MFVLKNNFLNLNPQVEIVLFDSTVKSEKYKFDRIYIGSEAYVKNLPTIAKLKTLQDKVTLVTPFATDFEMSALERLFRFLNKSS